MSLLEAYLLNLQASDDLNRNCWHFAAEGGSSETIQMLADLTPKDAVESLLRAASEPRKETPLHKAIDTKKLNPEVVRLLIENGAGVTKWEGNACNVSVVETTSIQTSRQKRAAG